MKKCPKCKNEIPEDSVFCHYCGAELTAKCMSCGNELPEGSIFCPFCGERIEPCETTINSMMPICKNKDRFNEVADYSSAKSNPAQKDKKARSIIISGIIVLLFICGGLFAVFNSADYRNFKEINQQYQSGNYYDILLTLNNGSNYGIFDGKVKKIKDSSLQAFYSETVKLYINHLNIETCKKNFNMLSKFDYKDSYKYLKLAEAKSYSGSNNDAYTTNITWLMDNLGFEDAKNVVMEKEEYLLFFLNGRWRDIYGEHYMEFNYEFDSGVKKCTYNMNSTYMSSTEFSLDNRDLMVSNGERFSITILTHDTIGVLSDGSVLYLHRENN